MKNRRTLVGDAVVRWKFLYAEVDENNYLDSFCCANGFERLTLVSNEGVKIPYRTVNNQCLYVQKLSNI